jgi:sugar-specific transcriptional regulator TrmB
MNEIFVLLGLSDLERKVFESVTDDPKLVATIAHEAKVPRTSVDAVVERLLNRGLLERKKRAKRFYYHKTPDRILMRKLFPQQVLPEGKYVMPLLSNAGVIIHAGTDNLFKLYESLFTKHSKSRIYGIQPTASALHILKKLPAKKVQYINSLISKNRVVNEMVLEEDYFRRIKEYDPKNFRRWLEHFADRAAITHIVKKGSISFDCELIIYEQTAVLVEWQNSVAIEIFHPAIVKMLRDLFDNFQALGTKVEHRTLAQIV